MKVLFSSVPSKRPILNNHGNKYIAPATAYGKVSGSAAASGTLPFASCTISALPRHLEAVSAEKSACHAYAYNTLCFKAKAKAQPTPFEEFAKETENLELPF